jgi:YidC/Oxa1 family membrane protein insertase
MLHIFDVLIVYPIINLLLVIYHGLSFIGIPFTLGFSIIFLTVFIRFLLAPFTAQQIRASQKMQQLSPHLSRVKELHKNDPKRLQAETMNLYKEHGVNPAAGCLTLLLQLPLLWGIYAVFDKVIKLAPDRAVATINDIAYSESLHLQNMWDTTFFGLPLEKTPGDLLSSIGVLILLVPVLTGVLQFIQSKMMFKKAPIDKAVAKKSDQPDFASVFQTQAMYLFPIMFGFLAYTFPLGLSLYWNTFSLFGIIQQYKLQKEQPGVLVSVQPAKKK